MPSKGAAVVDLCDLLDEILDSECRAGILEGLSTGTSLTRRLWRLRSAMASHTFEGVPGRFGPLVQELDRRTGKDGFRVLHSWNHTTHAFTDDLVPVLLLDFFERAEVPEPDSRTTLAILLDYYFMHVLALCAMRVWDTDRPDVLLDRLTLLVASLQGRHGSGHQFVRNAETLLIYALSQFHPEEAAYDRMIERVATLTEAHQVAFARVSAAVLSAHLRWGFWLMYDRDVVRMRKDNVGDYPWLLWSALTLLRAYARLEEPHTLDLRTPEPRTPEPRGSAPHKSDPRLPRERREIVGALLLALAADPWAFRGTVPPALESYGGEYAELREILTTHGVRLFEDMEAHRPTREVYAPLALHFNFPHNTLVAIVTLALLESKPQTLPLNVLLEAEYHMDTDGEVRETPEGLARLLMSFSGASPDRLGYRGAMLVAYDPLSGMRSYSMTVDALRKSLE
jgi:hypothetical protein